MTLTLAASCLAIGFSEPESAYNLKVIRNHPADRYKWGEFEGIDSVKAKYSRVHKIKRTGSMFDNIIYFNIALEEDIPHWHFEDGVVFLPEEIEAWWCINNR